METRQQTLSQNQTESLKEKDVCFFVVMIVVFVNKKLLFIPHPYLDIRKICEIRALPPTNNHLPIEVSEEIGSDPTIVS